MAVKPPKHLLQTFLHQLVVRGLYSLQTQKHHRTASLLLHVRLSCPLNIQPCKKFPILFPIFHGKEIPQHGKVQCLAKTAGPGNEGSLAVAVNHFFNKASLVNKAIFFFTSSRKSSTPIGMVFRSVVIITTAPPPSLSNSTFSYYSTTKAPPKRNKYFLLSHYLFPH